MTMLAWQKQSSWCYYDHDYNDNGNEHDAALDTPHPLPRAINLDKQIYHLPTTPPEKLTFHSARRGFPNADNDIKTCSGGAVSLTTRGDAEVDFGQSGPGDL